MHYYKRNLGDYAKKAGRLSMLQHGAYTLLIDTCYDREQFPTMAEAIDWTWASSTAEIEAVEFVLRKFFVLEGGVYVQKRIQEELDAYRAITETNARIARERETKRAEKSTERARSVNEASPVEHEAPPNHKPLTSNQEPIPKHAPLDGEESVRVVSGASSICMAMRVAGLASVNSSSPELLQLIESGADIGCFVDAARLAVKKGKGFAYALGIVSGQLQDAAAMAKTAMAARPKTPKPDDFSSIDYGQGGKL